MSAHIVLSKGMCTSVSDKDYALLSKHSWSAKRCRGIFYAVRTEAGRMIFMHREILGLGHGDKNEVDHINGDGLDNRRENLRACTHAENMRNRRKRKLASSKYKGVSWNKRQSLWEASIYFRNKRFFLGVFSDELAAAFAYDKASRNLHREFSATNQGKPS